MVKSKLPEAYAIKPEIDQTQNIPILQVFVFFEDFVLFLINKHVDKVKIFSINASHLSCPLDNEIT